MNSTDVFEAIVSEHYEALYRFALTLTRAESDACDLTQHTFYVWATKGQQMRDPARAKSWLFTTLYRSFLGAKRKQNKFPHCLLTDDDAETIPADSPDPGRKADASQILPALAKVHESFQSALALYYLDDHSYKEIAAILDVPLGTVKSRIARGVIQLREILNGNERCDNSLEWGSSATLTAEPIFGG